MLLREVVYVRIYPDINAFLEKRVPVPDYNVVQWQQTATADVVSSSRTILRATLFSKQTEIHTAKQQRAVAQRAVCAFNLRKTLKIVLLAKST